MAFDLTHILLFICICQNLTPKATPQGIKTNKINITHISGQLAKLHGGDASQTIIAGKLEKGSKDHTTFSM